MLKIFFEKMLQKNLTFSEYLYTVKGRDIMDKYIPESTTHDLKVMGL